MARAAPSAEAQRDLVLRWQCAPAWLKSGTLDPSDVQDQMAVQEDMVRTLMCLEAEPRQPSVCGPEA